LPDILGDFPDLNITTTSTPRRSGWGANVNTGLRAIKEQHVFQIEDDQLAQRTIDLERGVFVLEHCPQIGLVRYDGLAGHRLVLRLEETPMVKGRREHFLRIDKRLSSDQKELYGYSNRPHLKHKRFHQAYGAYPGGLALGSTEASFAHVVMESKGPPELVALSDGIDRAFKHIGKSRQFTTEDVGKDLFAEGLRG